MPNMQLKLKWIETETTLTMTTLTTLSLCDYCDWVPKLPKAALMIPWLSAVFSTLGLKDQTKLF